MVNPFFFLIFIIFHTPRKIKILCFFLLSYEIIKIQTNNKLNTINIPPWKKNKHYKIYLDTTAITTTMVYFFFHYPPTLKVQKKTVTTMEKEKHNNNNNNNKQPRK